MNDDCFDGPFDFVFAEVFDQRVASDGESVRFLDISHDIQPVVLLFIEVSLDSDGSGVR